MPEILGQTDSMGLPGAIGGRCAARGACPTSLAADDPPVRQATPRVPRSDCAHDVMTFGHKTWRGAEVQEGARWRNSVSLYKTVPGGRYHKTDRWFFWTGKMLCGVKSEGRPADCVRINRDQLDSWDICQDCAGRKGF